MIFETHAHYDDEQYNDDRENLLREIFSAGIERIVNVGATFNSSVKSLEMARKYEKMYAAVGIHPSEIDDLTDEAFIQLEKMATDDKVVAIGEIGLDYYWDKEKDVQERQKIAFKKQIDLAYKLNLPMIVHSRDASMETLEIIKKLPPRENPGIIHCYSYSVETAREYVKMGYYLGVGGVVTFKNAKALKEVVAEVGLEHIVVETDCPYLAPEPHRGKRNSSLYLPIIVDKIAELTNTSVQDVERITTDNARQVYRL